jgi:hypothetical protein
MDFWIATIGTIASVIGLPFAIAAAYQAWKAKRAAIGANAAATRAGKIVKNLTIGKELVEVKGLLRDLRRGIRWDDARELLTPISQTIVSHSAFVQNTPDLKVKFDQLKSALGNAEHALDEVKPVSPADEEKVPDAVYNQMESHFRAIGNALADFLGHLDLDNITINLKDDNDKT